MYGTKALGWGLPASILISLWLYLIVNSGWETGFKKENLVDALKTDIQ